MTDNAGLIKVGLSINPQERIKQLAVGNPSIRLLYKSQCISNCLYVEQNIHKKLESSHVSGEWFSCSTKYAISSVKAEVVLSGAAPVEAAIDHEAFNAEIKITEWKQLGCAAESTSLKNYKIVEHFIRLSDNLQADFYMLNHSRQYLIASNFFATAFLATHGYEV